MLSVAVRLVDRGAGTLPVVMIVTAPWHYAVADASGVVAVAARVDGHLVGLAANSFTSVSLDPPLVSFSIANASKTWPDLRRAAHLGVTVVPSALSG
jgi:flavin reductase (DIM6/NTAB) family NADH-FMN oxidoreductase RutF